MLNFKKIIGIAAIIAVIGMAFFSCEEEKPGLVPGLLKAPAIGTAPNFEGADVAKADAESLFYAMLNDYYSFGISTAKSAARTRALAIYYNSDDYSNYISSSVTSYSRNLNYNDATVSEKFKESIGINNSTIKGSSKYSWSSNLTWAEYNDSTRPIMVGDTETEKSSSNGTITIPGLKASSSNPAVKFGGTVTANVSSSSTEKLTIKDVEAGNFDTEKGKGTGKFAATVTYFDGTVGAKFRFSCSYGQTGYQKAAGGEQGYAVSDIEVYKNDGTLLTTIKDFDSYLSLTNFFSTFQLY